MESVSITVKPHHLFRYPSEWDPRQQGKTKGGYLEGSIQLPKVDTDLRILLTTCPADRTIFPAKLAHTPEVVDIHPTLLHVVRKGKGNRRDQDKEPVPNINHFQQEFVVRNRRLFIRNKTSIIDKQRSVEGMPSIPDEDEVFTLDKDMTLRFGKDARSLNIIILIPKTAKRSNEKEVSLNRVLSNRVSDQDTAQQLVSCYTGKNSLNLKQLRLRVEVFCLDTGRALGSAVTTPISDTASKAHGALDLHDATPLVSCGNGGRKVVIVSEFGLARDVEPRFQLYNENGDRLKTEEELWLTQPVNQIGARSVEVLKETIVFITPPQPKAEEIWMKRWKIRLVVRRESDGLVSKKKFDFQYLPHDYYTPCVFCEIFLDRETPGPNRLVPEKERPGPGLRKRRMSDTEVREFSLMKDVTVKSEDVACNQNPASLRLDPGITPPQYSNPSTNPTTKSGEVMYLDSPDTEGNEARKSRLIAEAEADSEDELCRELEIREDYNDLDELDEVKDEFSSLGAEARPSGNRFLKALTS